MIGKICTIILYSAAFTCVAILSASSCTNAVTSAPFLCQGGIVFTIATTDVAEKLAKAKEDGTLGFE